MMENIITPVIVMAALGVLFGLTLAFVLRIFGIKVDSAIAKIMLSLPGINCGACGRPGCAAFASALNKREAEPSACVVSSDEQKKAIAKILGIDFVVGAKTIATVLCNGGKNDKDKFNYRGIKTCKAASLVFGGQKECAFGCLGFGDCIEACPFGAMSMSDQGVPEIDRTKCTSCGKCVKACPKKIIVLMAADRPYYVKCSSKDTGRVVSKVCKSGCIACAKCVKACPNGAIKITENLSRIDYDLCKDAGKCMEACPTKVIFKRS